MNNNWQPYTIELYKRDYPKLLFRLQCVENITLSIDELPSIYLEDSILFINTNIPEAEMVYYFLDTYPQKISQIYCLIFWNVEIFINIYRNRLIKDGLIKHTLGNQYIEAAEPLIKTIIDSFVPLNKFPFTTSNLFQDAISKLSYSKVLGRAKELIKIME